MNYTYSVYRKVWTDIDIEAESEEEAQEKFEEMESNGDITDLLRDELLEAFTEVEEILEDGVCIYSVG